MPRAAARARTAGPLGGDSHMRGTRWSMLACALAGTLIWAAPAMADGEVPGHLGRPDIDVRGGDRAPTSAQRDGVRDLGALVAWNRFGTPSTIVGSGGGLGPAGAGAPATDAARAWAADNRALFRLSSVDGLERVADSKLTGGQTHAVTFRQRVGGLE